MSKSVQGIVMEIKTRSCIIMTRDGEFYKVSRPAGEIMVGEEIRVQLGTWSKWLRWSSLAAVMVLMVMGCYFYRYTVPVAAAHVSLDINPSMELCVDRSGCIIDGVGFNEEGENLLAAVPLKGKDIYSALSELIVVAIQQNYLTPGKDNLVFSTVVGDPTELHKVVEEEQVYRTIVSSVETSNIPVEVLVTTVKPELQQQARHTGVSTGRFLLYQETLMEEPKTKDYNLKTKDLKDLKIEQWYQKHQNEVKSNHNQKNELKDDLKKIKQKGNAGQGNKKDKKQLNEGNKAKPQYQENRGQEKKSNENNENNKNNKKVKIKENKKGDED